jgi:hypothetical protein
MSLEPFLNAPVDYSPEFTARVRSIADALSAALSVPVRHQTDMNYNPGQLLIIHLTESGNVTPDETSAAYALKIAISSRGPLWALLVTRSTAPRTWHPATPADLPPAATPILTTIEQILTDAALTRVPDETLAHPVPGRTTDLDGAPATIRDLLFCELC